MSDYSVVCFHGRFTERHCEECQDEATRYRELSSKLAAAEAREVALRDALAVGVRWADTPSIRIYLPVVELGVMHAALRAPRDVTALREFGLRVARAYELLEVVTPEDAVAAVLRGER